MLLDLNSFESPVKDGKQKQTALDQMLSESLSKQSREDRFEVKLEETKSLKTNSNKS